MKLIVGLFLFLGLVATSLSERCAKGKISDFLVKNILRKNLNGHLKKKNLIKKYAYVTKSYYTCVRVLGINHMCQYYTK